MNRRFWLPLGFLTLGACTVGGTELATDENGIIAELPEAVVAIAAPYQNLEAVILREEDGCYWYRHVGPVETTELPLRTTAGRKICVPRPEAEVS